MLHRISLSVLLLGLLALAGCGKPSDDADGAGVPDSDPAVQGQLNFATLINGFAQGKADRTPWVGSWWPYVDNGIASGGGLLHKSAAGKYDSARGRATEAEKWEVRNHGKKVQGVQGWWGHCNGWSAAAVLYPEPKHPVEVGHITFGVADIKALLTETAMETDAEFFGNRVDSAADYHSPKYDDVVPDEYFLVLTHRMGRQKEPVIIDRHTGDQVWNQPVAGYRFDYPKAGDYLGASPEAPNVYRILMTSTIWWVRDDVDPGSVTPVFDFRDGPAFQSRVLKMELWLDGPVEFDHDGKVVRSGNIVVARDGTSDFVTGGAWRMGGLGQNDLWPDYMWIPHAITPSTGYSNSEIDPNWLMRNLISSE